MDNEDRKELPAHNRMHRLAEHGGADLAGGDEGDPAAEYRPERELASAVFRQAFLDLGVRADGRPGKPRSIERLDEEHQLARRSAKAFLFDPEWSGMRQFWLAWLGMSEGDLMAMLGKATHQGQKNRVLVAIGGRLPGRERVVCAGSRVGKTHDRTTRP